MKKSTSIKIDEDIWKTARKRAIDIELTVGGYLEKLIMDDIDRYNKNLDKK